MGRRNEASSARPDSAAGDGAGAGARAGAAPARSGDPRHVAVIMDGNGRWARRRGLPRNAGHRAGVKAARAVVEACGKRGIGYLTLFAFSSENWSRPETEVGLLMRLFVEALQREVDGLHRNGVRVRFVGERSRLAPALMEQIAVAENLTAANSGMQLTIAVAYGGRWDIAQATRALAREVQQGKLAPEEIDQDMLGQRLAFGGLPDADLFIRTGGERRLSNFMLWNLAYTELYFSDFLWPDFDTHALHRALDFFASRERRFGMTPAQIEQG